VNIRGSRGRQWRLLEHDLEAWFVDGGLTMVPRCGVVVISDESPALRRNQRRHLRVSCPSSLLGIGLSVRWVSVAHHKISVPLLLSSGAPKNGAPLVKI
jgi:hypothetical protein